MQPDDPHAPDGCFPSGEWLGGCRRVVAPYQVQLEIPAHLARKWCLTRPDAPATNLPDRGDVEYHYLSRVLEENPGRLVAIRDGVRAGEIGVNPSCKPEALVAYLDGLIAEKKAPAPVAQLTGTGASAQNAGQLLMGWKAICKAVGLEPNKGRFLRDLNRQYGGPIPACKPGKRPKVREVPLRAWFEPLEAKDFKADALPVEKPYGKGSIAYDGNQPLGVKKRH